MNRMRLPVGADRAPQACKFSFRGIDASVKPSKTFAEGAKLFDPVGGDENSMLARHPQAIPHGSDARGNYARRIRRKHSMNDNGPDNPDALFWFGNERGAALVNFTTGQALAIITERAGSFQIEHRFALWRRILHRVASHYTFDFRNMAEAIQSVDASLVKVRAIPKRRFLAERYYFVADMVFGPTANR